MSAMMTFGSQNLDPRAGMTEEDIRKVCPMAYAEVPTNSSVSDKYVMVNTGRVIEDMKTLGWKVVAAKQRKPQKNSAGRFSFHMIAFQNPDIKITKTITNDDGSKNEEVDCFPRIILTNSSDGMNCFKLMCGLFRLICSNGLIICSDSFGEVNIRHINYTFEELQEAVKKFVEALPEKIDRMNLMKSITLTEDQKKKFALEAFKIRKDVKEEDEFNVDDETLVDILTPVRKEDEGNDLWTVFNMVQEKMTKGGFMYGKGDGKKARKVRKVSGFVKDLYMNMSLWKLAESYM